MTSDPVSATDIDALHAQGEQGTRHRTLLQDANTTLAASPAPALLDSMQTIHRILLAANPKALRSDVGWFGRLLGRDIVLQAESEALRSELGVHVMQARRQLVALTAHDAQLQSLGLALNAAIDGVGEQTSLLADRIVAGDVTDNTKRMQHLAMLAASLRISASHLELTMLNHRDLKQRVEQMLPRVELLLDQQRMLRAGLSEQVALLAATHSLEALQGLEHVNVTEVTPR